MPKSNMVPINTQYFQQIVSESNLTKEEFASSIGRSVNTINGIARKKEAQAVIAKMICKVHGADYGKLTCAASASEKAESRDAYKQETEKIRQLLYLLMVEVEAMHRENKDFYKRVLEVLE